MRKKKSKPPELLELLLREADSFDAALRQGALAKILRDRPDLIDQVDAVVLTEMRVARRGFSDKTLRAVTQDISRRLLKHFPPTK